jgi:hypothetical protein
VQNAQADAVESANIVGYQSVEIPTGFSLFTVTFENVDGGEYDLKNIKLLDENGAAIESSNGKVRIQKMDSTGAYLTGYPYRTTRGGWCSGNTLLADGAVTFKSGEAFCVNNGGDTKVQFQVSGSVTIAPQSTSIAAGGFTLIGNMTPQTIDLKSIVPMKEDGSAIETSNGKIRVQKMATDGAYLTGYPYRTTRGGWCSGNTLLADGAVTLAPGESVCVNNGEDFAIVFKFPSPISK